MPDLLLELRSEEIPARMQRKTAGELKKLVTDALMEAGLTYEGAQEYWTPRRLALDIRGLTARSRDVRDAIKGPSTKAPDAAVQGFLRKAGLTSLSEAHVHSDPKKGDFYVAHIVKPGRAAEAIIAEVMPGIIRDFPWPKSMRWGAASAKPGALRWVRPLQSILCTFGPETEEPTVVDFAVDGLRAGNKTVGHRFHAPGEIVVKRFEDYAAKLEAAHVVLDAERRKNIILSEAENLAFANGLELVEDEGLLEEVSGLVEWPVVLMGEFEEAFLEIPPEVIRLTIRANQKCFVTRHSSPLEGEVSAQRTEGVAPEGTADNAPRTAAATPTAASGGTSPSRGEGALANRFILTANIDARDGGAEIARGNGKVVRARLSDALYFWRTDQSDLPDLDQLKASAEKFELDLRHPLDQRMARLDHLNVTFHAELGTQGERVERIRRLARELAPLVGADPDLAERAAVLAKADLQTEVVGEFPELQGVMGRKYAALQGEQPSVAAAIEEHYKPQGPSDRVPSDPVSIAVALAEKLDTLVGFWAIDEKPTGSKDPYALRRAALGMIRIIVENGTRLGVRYAAIEAFEANVEAIADQAFHQDRIEASNLDAAIGGDSRLDDVWNAQRAYLERLRGGSETVVRAVIGFLHDRLKIYLRDQGARHDLIDAVLAARSVLSPLEGEMAAKRSEGVASEGTATSSAAAATPPGPAGHLPAGSPLPAAATQPSPTSHRATGTMSTLREPAAQPLKGEGDATRAGNDDLLSIVRRVEALGRLLDTDDGKNLLAGTKRAVNILAAEEKKGTTIGSQVDPALFHDEAEESLFTAVNLAENAAGQAIRQEDFSAAMRALSLLREPVDLFFEKVLVNDEDPAIRANRLALLARIRAVAGQVADFSKIAG